MRSIRPDDVPEPVRRICTVLRDAGHRAWVVGGCVRDVLLGIPAKDWDVATSAKPAEVQKLFRRVIPTGIDHGTVTVLIDGAHYEVTTLRGETTYSDGRHPDSVYFVDDIADDLARRDFTVNAIAYDPLADVVIDPYEGRRDLEARRIRAVGDPAKRFGEDGLRILRAARFAATLEMDLDPETEAAIPGALDVFRKVSPERVREEWLKALRAKRPSRAFEVMRRSGILGVTCPVMLEQFGCEQNKWHAYDVWHHTMACLDASEGDPVLRLSVLLHDLGKPRSRQFHDEKQDWTFYHHEVIGADLADGWMRELRFSNEERTRVVELVRHHLICYSDEWSDAALRRWIRRVGPGLVDDLLALARADALGKGRPVDEELAALERLRERYAAQILAQNALTTRDLAISGHDVMQRLGIAPGRVIGQVLERLLERVIEDPSLNEREALLKLVDEVYPSLAPSSGSS
jgi:tRNA nucleotidyltransferase (CCA-adding enzyme)